MNDNHEQSRSTMGADDSNIRVGAFSKRRNPIESIIDQPENDNSSATRLTQQALHVDQDENHQTATTESIIALHQRLEYEASLRLYQNTKLLLCNLIEVSPRGNLTLINLSRRGIGREEAILIREAIHCNPHLYVLKLPYNNLGDDGASIIASAISITIGEQHRHVSVLDLGFNSIGDTGCGALALHCIAGNSHLQSLCLSANQFGSEGACAIATAIMHGTGLRNLHLTANNIGPNGMKDIASAITKNESQILQLVASGDIDSNSVRPMEELYVGSSSITSEGFGAISIMVLMNSSLRSLSLCDNNVNDHDMMLLSQALTQNNKQMPLESIQLSFNQITCQGVEYFMNAVWGSTTLREIKLDNNKIKDRGAQLCAVVLTSIELRTLDLSFNKVSTVGLKALMKTLTDNTSLHSLAIAGIHIDQTASKAVSYALAYNSTLTSLYLDNCSTGYASQRHIVAGAVSNSRSSLRILTGFGISQIAMTLGMPWLPEIWTNDQVLSFFRFMWQKWLQKSPNNDIQRGPAPPAAVAAASKIAFSSLGPDAVNMLRTEDHRKPIREGAPVEPATSAFLERTESGTISVPVSSVSVEMDIAESVTYETTSTSTSTIISVSAQHDTNRSLLEDPERRNLNVRWLRHHFRYLSDVGRLPFHNADLWQLHQYYFSPPAQTSDTSSTESNSKDPSENVNAALVTSNDVHKLSPENSALYQTFADAFSGVNEDVLPHGMKRTSPLDSNPGESGPVYKKAKNVKKRIEYYPRIMAKLQSLGTKPIAQTLSLLRQLKYTESSLLAGVNLYDDHSDVNHYPSYLDVEMILLDIL